MLGGPSALSRSSSMAGRMLIYDPRTMSLVDPALPHNSKWSNHYEERTRLFQITRLPSPSLDPSSLSNVHSSRCSGHALSVKDAQHKTAISLLRNLLRRDSSAALDHNLNYSCWFHFCIDFSSVLGITGQHITDNKLYIKQDFTYRETFFGQYRVHQVDCPYKSCITRRLAYSPLPPC